jgi:hypothetical protein
MEGSNKTPYELDNLPPNETNLTPNIETNLPPNETNLAPNAHSDMNQARKIFSSCCKLDCEDSFGENNLPQNDLISDKTKGVPQRNFDALNIALRSKFQCAKLLAFCA